MDLPLNDELYSRFRALLLARAGLHYPERRRPDLAHALGQVAQQLGLADLGSLYGAIAAGGPAWELAVAQLTIGETYFMRNGAQFAALRERILPDLLARRRAARSLRLWSAGCATGEEPYSLAIALAEALPPAEEWQVSILATDLNPQFLERAREGLYGSWSFREVPEELRALHFTPEGPRWRLRPELRRQVMFARLNLAEPCYPAIGNGTVALDLIFCRNVTIYFDEATTRQVVERFYAALAPGGWLVVGHAEPHTEIYRAFETHNVPGAVLYRKPLSAPAFLSLGPSSPPVALPPPHLQPPPIVAPAPAARPLPAAPPRPPDPAPSPPAVDPPPPPPPPDPLAPARAAADRGDWAAASTVALAVLAAEPLCAEAHALLGQVHEHTGDPEAALAAYRRSVYLDPGWTMGHLGMAGALRQMGRLAEARRCYRSALHQLAGSPPAARVPGADGASAAELTAYVRTQLDLLG
jgi:chemotaxis protein methyltransferase CheR